MRRNSFARTSSPSSSEDHTSSLPPFPSRQLLVLAICRICEPIAFMGIFPYVYFMIEDFHVTDDANRISFYAGLVTSAFTFAEFSTGILWGRLSDKIGRKPVLLTGLAGTALSVLVFGFAPNLTVALLARAIGGLLNGNQGVLQSTVAELVTAKEHQPRAYTIMPVVWCLGSIIGPMIGGALARPCISYPQLFSPGTIWDRYPYLLPNLFSAFIVLVGVINGFLFLEETHVQKKMQRDPGLELGDWILSKLTGIRKCAEPRDEKSKFSDRDEIRPLLDHDEQLPTYQTNENTPVNSPRLRSASVTTIAKDPLDLTQSKDNLGMGISQTFTRPVVLNIISFGILAFHTMTFDQLLPVFLATAPPKDEVEPSLPFKFVDGFNLDSKTVGIILSIQGVYQLLLNTVVVPKVLRRFGALRSFRFIVVAYFLLYLVTPYLVLLPSAYRMVGLAVVLVWKCTFATVVYPSNAILTADSAPSRLALGTINGVAASTASLCRAFGPTISGILYSVGLQSGYSGLAWWFTAVVAIGGAVAGLMIPDPSRSPACSDNVNAHDRDLEIAEQDRA
ncbi:major facilitator superfamily domain-containing protein [Xylaria bambusicola]|uniref:major facilitator superfamily domain-containing protein n=1 Tax=Xylaria bambusicola TaxID=326684 RepID=UPI002007CFD5|nr:major facilitator superfamily domain-containing protein [Xylaria bambusicola]KAI0509344.1 major facilitator superfamily domain-containing protein [Xylaria bambusicola]